MEVLLNLIIKRGEGHHLGPAPGPATTAAAGNPPSLSPATSLQIRFPTVDPAHFKEILEN